MPTSFSAINTGVIITLLFLWTVASITLGGIAWSRINSLSLSFPTSLGALSTLYPLLPFLSALIANIIASRYQRRHGSSRKNQITTSSYSDETGNHRTSGAAADLVANLNGSSAGEYYSFFSFAYPIVNSIIDQLLTLLPVVLATWAATYIAPSDNNCHLEQTWQSYYRNKDVNSIRAIQDQLQCCGLRSTRDRAWPFKDSTHGDDACERSIGYTQSCLQPWSEQERRVGVLVLIAAFMGWGIKLGIDYFSPRSLYAFDESRSRRNAWMKTANPGNDAHPGSTVPRMILYSDNANPNLVPGDEEAPDEDLPVGKSPLLNPDARDLSSPEGRDLTGSSPWRDNT